MSSLYFITINTYGSWLPGDPRGSMWRGERVEGGRPWLYNRSRRLLKHAPVSLTEAQRRAAVDAIVETCRYRDWACHAANVRTQHLHAALQGPENGRIAATALKANMTRVMRQRELVARATRVWAEGASIREIAPEKLDVACRYALDGQGANVEGCWFDGREVTGATKPRGGPEAGTSVRPGRIWFAVGDAIGMP